MDLLNQDFLEISQKCSYISQKFSYVISLISFLFFFSSFSNLFSLSFSSTFCRFPQLTSFRLSIGLLTSAVIFLISKKLYLFCEFKNFCFNLKIF